MRTMAVVLILTALTMLAARLAYEAPAVSYHLGTLLTDNATSPITPPLMYAGVRG